MSKSLKDLRTSLTASSKSLRARLTIEGKGLVVVMEILDSPELFRPDMVLCFMSSGILAGEAVVAGLADFYHGVSLWKKCLKEVSSLHDNEKVELRCRGGHDGELYGSYKTE